jgi:DNA-binding NtrC family response regulator
LGAPVLIIGKDWRSRALLRAQLKEEGLDVEAYESAKDVLASVSQRPRLPKLIVADLFGSDDPVSEIERLGRWAQRAPVWLLISHGTASASAAEGRGFERIWFRPVDLGSLVAAVKARVSSH